MIFKCPKCGRYIERDLRKKEYRKFYSRKTKRYKMWCGNYEVLTAYENPTKSKEIG